MMTTGIQEAWLIKGVNGILLQAASDSTKCKMTVRRPFGFVSQTGYHPPSDSDDSYVNDYNLVPPPAPELRGHVGTCILKFWATRKGSSTSHISTLYHGEQKR
jgi:hypothetical protein